MSAIKPLCPTCGAQHTVKNGSIHNKKLKYKCLVCGRQFVESPSKKVIEQETKDIIDKLLVEKIPLAGIARVMGVSQKWLQDYVNAKYGQVSQRMEMSQYSPGKLTIECDVRAALP